MKLRVTFKDPDTLGDAIEEAVRREIVDMPNLDAAEREAVAELRREKVGEAVAKWFRWGEYVTVECDTDAGTATVIEARG